MNNPNRERGLEIQDEIRHVLLTYWDPIGIKDEPKAQDEYDGYVGPIYRLLASGASTEQIAKHLAGLLAKMGLESVPPTGLLGVAERLTALDVSLAGEAG